jgi:hypothetical protein
MISLVSEGLTSTHQYSLIVQGLRSDTLSSPPPPTILDNFYPETYEGVVQAAADVLLSNYLSAPYTNSWRGVVDVIKDSSRGAGLIRGEGYPPSVRGVIEVIADKFGSTTGLEVRHRFPLTFEGIVEAIVFYINPSGALAPYSDGFEGIVNALRDCRLAIINNPPAGISTVLDGNSITVYWEYPSGCVVSNNPPTLLSASASASNININWKRPDGCV